MGRYLAIGEKEILQECIAALVAAGFDTIPAAAGLEALAAYQSVAEDTAPSFIDVAIPARDSIKAIQVIEEQDQIIKIFIISGYLDMVPALAKSDNQKSKHLWHSGGTYPEQQESRCGSRREKDWAKGWTRSLKGLHKRLDA